MTSDDRTVQVPVSLIDDLAAALEAHADHAYCQLGVDDEDYKSIEKVRALLSQPTPTAEPVRTPCAAETHSWDHFRPEQVDSYWITCDVLGPHDEHEDEQTGLTWRDPSMIRDVTPPKDAA